MKTAKEAKKLEEKFSDFGVVTETKKVKIDKYSSRSQSVITEEELRERAKFLICEPIDNRSVFGYISLRNGAPTQNKYNKNTGEFVCYNNDKILYNCIKTWGEYTGDKSFEYYDEIG